MLKINLFKFLPIIILVIQTTFYVLLVRYSLKDGKRAYIQSSVVFATESVKTLTSLTVLYNQKHGFKNWLHCIKHDVLNPYQIIEISGLSLLFTMQNNLGYFAMENLEAGVFLVISQLKIMTMAIFVVLILKRKLSITQWISLLLLTFGVSLMHFSPEKITQSTKTIVKVQKMRGFIAVVITALSSGFACVYNEKILCRSTKSFWVTNAQMYITGSLISLILSIFRDSKRILNEGFLTGYNIPVICIIMLSSMGGLTVSVVLKTSGNIAKSFGTSFSVIATTLLSHFFFNEPLNYFNIFGIVNVVVAVPIFALSGMKRN